MMAEDFYGVRDMNRIKPKDGPTLMVQATRDGHFKCLRPAYDNLTGVRLPAFEIPVKLFSPSWMEPIDDAGKAVIEAYKVQKIKDEKVKLLAELAAKKKALEDEEVSLKAVIGDVPVAAEVPAASASAESEIETKEVKRGPGRPKKA